jgi:hypothetical protein
LLACGESTKFQALAALAIVLNVTYLGFYAEWTISNEYRRLDSLDFQESLWIIPQLFEIWFLVECAVRITAWRAQYFFGDAAFWNWLDFLVVVVPTVSLIKVWLSPDENYTNGTMGFKMPGLSVLRCMRIVRLAHTLELFRLPLFAEFRMIVNSLILSLPSFIWVSLLAGFCVYVFGVFFALGVGGQLQSYRPENTGDLVEATKLRIHWGSLSEGILKLFMSVTNGVDWHETWSSIGSLHSMYKFGFITWIVFMAFAMLNIISGMFIERAFRVVNSDRDFWIIEEARQHRMYADRLMGLFHELDLDHSYALSWDEFDNHLSNPHIAAYFSWLGVDISNAFEVFQILDSDSDGKVTVKEFLEGCIDLKGTATNVALKGLRITVETLHEQFMDILRLRAAEGEAKTPMRVSRIGPRVSVHKRQGYLGSDYRAFVQERDEANWSNVDSSIR